MSTTGSKSQKVTVHDKEPNREGQWTTPFRTVLAVCLLASLPGLSGCGSDETVVTDDPVPLDGSISLRSPEDSAWLHADSVKFTWSYSGGLTGQVLFATVTIAESGQDVWTSQGTRQYSAGTNTSLTVSLADLGGWRNWGVSASNAAGDVRQSPPRSLNVLVQPGGSGDPDIEFTSVPQFGTTSDLQGRVLHVWPDECLVAIYLYVNGGWWTKPYWSTPTTAIDDTGGWTCDVTTGGIDERATQYVAFLIPNDYDPPLAYGESSLPEELNRNCLARVQVSRSP